MSFSIPIDKLAAKSKAKLETVARRATLQVFTEVVQASPVDTGRFRANWNGSSGSPDYTTTASTNQGRGLQEASKALTANLASLMYLTNALPYARRLEYGWSQQAPSGMVRISAMRFAEAVRKAIA
jgi:hypothetical protein